MRKNRGHARLDHQSKNARAYGVQCGGCERGLRARLPAADPIKQTTEKVLGVRVS